MKKQYTLPDKWLDVYIEYKAGIWIVWQKEEKRVKTNLDVDDVEWSWMTITGLDDTNTASVTTSGDHAQVARVELDMLSDWAGFDVKDNGIVDLDVWWWVTDGTGVVGDDVWNTLKEIRYF